MSGSKTQFRKWRALGGLGIVAATVFFAAVGGGFSAQAAAKKSAARKSPINVISVGDWTQPPPSGYTPVAADSIGAALKTINAAGGVNGHPIKVTFCDTKSNPNTALACAKEAASGKFVADIGTETYYDQTTSPIMAKAGLSQIGVLTNSPQAWNSKTTFAAYSGYNAQELAFGPLAKRIGAHKVAIWETGGEPTTAPSLALTEQGLKAAGLQVGADVEPDFGVTDPTADLAQAMSGNPDAIVVTDLDFAGLPTVIHDLRTSYPNVKILVNSFMIDTQTLAAMGSAANGIYASAWGSSPWTPTVPGIKQYVREMKAYHGFRDQDEADSGVQMWLSAYFFAEVAKTIKGPVTKQSVLKAVRHAKNINFGGIEPNFSSSNLGKYGAKGIASDAISPWVIKKGVPADILPDGEYINATTGKIIKSTTAKPTAITP